jgi:hypothetical protein
MQKEKSFSPFNKGWKYTKGSLVPVEQFVYTLFVSFPSIHCSLWHNRAFPACVTRTFTQRRSIISTVRDTNPFRSSRAIALVAAAQLTPRDDAT